MFTGLVECLGTIERITPLGEALQLQISVADEAFLRDAQLGESISVNGCCLTATELGAHYFVVQAVEETMRRTTLGLKKEGDKVNLERALQVGARLGGHIVQGHVDGVATVTVVRPEGEGWWISFEPPSSLMKYIIEKGSICLDGISLTVANVAYSRFSVALIPHTREVTTAGDWQTGYAVNVEVDMIAKYVEKLTLWTREAPI
ncbi:MAG TPA: riboflavin synthase [Abditibacteriaceae bacterium]|jgi:riboflavin synthase